MQVFSIPSFFLGFLAHENMFPVGANPNLGASTPAPLCISTQIENFEKFCVTREGFLAFAKYKKIQHRIQWLQRIFNKYLTKGKIRGLSLFTKNIQI